MTPTKRKPEEVVVSAKKCKISTSASASASASASSEVKKKKKGSNINNKLNGNKSPPGQSEIIDGLQIFTLPEIREKIINLSKNVPEIPIEGIDPEDPDAVRAWAMQMQAVIEEFNLSICCVSTATYKWGSDRSGAGDQNLSWLVGELGNAQDQISSSISPRLTNVLAPVVDLVIKKVVITKDENSGEESRVNEFSREEVDPDFLRLCRGVLARNAKMLRHVVLTNFHRIGRSIDDYLKATHKDSHDDRGGFSY